MSNVEKYLRPEVIRTVGRLDLRAKFLKEHSLIVANVHEMVVRAAAVATTGWLQSETGDGVGLVQAVDLHDDLVPFDRNAIFFDSHHVGLPIRRLDTVDRNRYPRLAIAALQSSAFTLPHE